MIKTMIRANINYIDLLTAQSKPVKGYINIYTSDKNFKETDIEAIYHYIDGLENYVFYTGTDCRYRIDYKYFQINDSLIVNERWIHRALERPNSNDISVFIRVIKAVAITRPKSDSIVIKESRRMKILMIVKDYKQNDCVHPHMYIRTVGNDIKNQRENILELVGKDRFIKTTSEYFQNNSNFCDDDKVIHYKNMEFIVPSPYGKYFSYDSYFDPDCKIVDCDINDRIKNNLDFFDAICIEECMLPEANNEYYKTINNLNKYEKVKLLKSDNYESRINVGYKEHVWFNRESEYYNATTDVYNYTADNSESLIYKSTSKDYQINETQAKLPEYFGIENQSEELHRLNEISQRLSDELAETVKQLNDANHEIAKLKAITVKFGELAKLLPTNSV
jgi:hypothetical protein